jgi:hypothetical protein
MQLTGHSISLLQTQLTILSFPIRQMTRQLRASRINTKGSESIYADGVYSLVDVEQS